MVKIVCVRFRMAGKIYYFAPGDLDIKRGDNIIVETARGVEFGTAVSDIREISEEEIVSPLKAVIRMADENDVETEKNNRVREREAFKVCQEKIRKHELDMKLIDAEYTFDSNKLLFYFTADGRIDFRELVKDLASVFRTRIELRQIGVRDETKILGGYGICGRPLCCHTYLSDFQPVSIKMAKEQNLSLNPTKISGMCGRLMCCLQNEEETYEELNAALPSIGDIVTDKEEGISGEVQSVNVLRQKVKVLIEQGDEKEVREYEVKNLDFVAHHKKGTSNWAKEKQKKEKDKREKEALKEADIPVEELVEELKEEKQEQQPQKNQKNQNRNNQKKADKNRDKSQNRDQNKNQDKNSGNNQDRSQEKNPEKNQDKNNNRRNFDKKPKKNFDKNQRFDKEKRDGGNNFKNKKQKKDNNTEKPSKISENDGEKND
ncbi:stage 0 sporulation family protein [Lachnospiraceae bacterium C1.1]|nr:stage 0 sporulation family protein [Lachnospiraceae bacterium C1.1]